MRTIEKNDQTIADINKRLEEMSESRSYWMNEYNLIFDRLKECESKFKKSNQLIKDLSSLL